MKICHFFIDRPIFAAVLSILITLLGGFAFFGESFHALEYAGAALTLLATWQVVRTPA